MIDGFMRLAPGRKAMVIAGIFFLLGYFTLGLIFLFVKNLPFVMSPAMKTGFGIILIAYSVFRFARLVISLKSETRRGGEEDNDDGAE